MTDESDYFDRMRAEAFRRARQRAIEPPIGFSQAPAVPHADAMTQLTRRMADFESRHERQVAEAKASRDVRDKRNNELEERLIAVEEQHEEDRTDFIGRIEALEKALPHPISSVCTGLYGRLEALEVSVGLITDKRLEGYEKLSELWRGPVDRPITVELLTAALLRDQQIFLHGSNFSTPITPMGVIEADAEELDRKARWHQTRDAVLQGALASGDSVNDAYDRATLLADRAHGPLEANRVDAPAGDMTPAIDSFSAQVNALVKAAKAARERLKRDGVYFDLCADLSAACRPFEAST